MSGPFLRRFQSVATRKGNAPAVIIAADGSTTTFAELDRLAREQTANPALADLRGRIALLALPNSPEWLVAFLALRIAGAIVVPVDPGTPPTAIEALARTLGAALVRDEAGPRATGIPTRRRNGDLLLGKLTSGSTGAPKAYFFTEMEMISDADTVMEAMSLTPDDLNHAGLPFGHSYALGNLVLPLFVSGMPMVVASSPMPQIVASEIARYGATVLPTVPVLVAALRNSDIPPAKLASLRRVISAGARLDPEEARAFAEKFGRRVHNFYGSTETGAVAYDASGEESLSGASLGTIVPRVSVTRMRDGRLLVSGPSVTTFGNPKRREGFGANRMPDIGHIDEAGRIVVEGRAGTLVKIGGRRINPAEVEHALRKISGVRDAFVHALPGPGGECRLAALVAGDGDPRELRRTLRETLPAWKIPARVEVVAAFPLTPRGKPDRAAMITILAS